MDAEPSEGSESEKSERFKISISEIGDQSNGKPDNGVEALSPRKRIKRPKKRVAINPPSFPQELLFKEQPHIRIIDSGSARRYRRPINYMKLNEGILCESERPEVDETNYESDLSKKRLEQAAFDPFSMEERQEELEQIEEEEEKSNEKDNPNYNNLNYIFSQDFLELKPLSSFNICNPSPSFRHNAHLDELIVIGTHLKLLPSQNLLSELNDANDKERKKSEEEFIEEILEINFDPGEAFA
jgi:hypothetical protein